MISAGLIDQITSGFSVVAEGKTLDQCQRFCHADAGASLNRLPSQDIGEAMDTKSDLPGQHTLSLIRSKPESGFETEISTADATISQLAVLQVTNLDLFRPFEAGF